MKENSAPLRRWCQDINQVQAGMVYDFLYVDQESLERYRPVSFRKLLDAVRAYKGNL